MILFEAGGSAVKGLPYSASPSLRLLGDWGGNWLRQGAQFTHSFSHALAPAQNSVVFTHWGTKYKVSCTRLRELCPNSGVVPTMLSTSVVKLALHNGRNNTLYGVILVSIPDRSAVQYKVNMDVFLFCLQAKGGKMAAEGVMVVYHLLEKNRLVDNCSKWDASNPEW